jgi:hypothetical protein
MMKKDLSVNYRIISLQHLLVSIYSEIPVFERNLASKRISQNIKFQDRISDVIEGAA